ncbi:MAG: MbnP family protein [Cytophagales bacterium]
MKHILIIYLSCSILLSCNKSTKTESIAPQAGDLSITPTFSAGTQSFSFDTPLVNDSSANYTISSCRYYLSDIRLTQKNGTIVEVDTVFLVSPNRAAFTLKNIPSSEYSKFEFTLGLDSVLNHKDPAIYPLSHPLAYQSPAIHWSWNTGYIFMMIEGSCDTTQNNNGTTEFGSYPQAMFYHIGMDEFKRNISLSYDFSVSTNSGNNLNLNLDINKILKGLNIKKENATHSMMSGYGLAKKVANNFPSSFTLSK